jgi:hypothetical protein
MMFSVSKVMFAVDVGRNLDITSPSERPHPVHDLAVTGLISMDWWCTIALSYGTFTMVLPKI